MSDGGRIIDSYSRADAREAGNVGRDGSSESGAGMLMVLSAAAALVVVAEVAGFPAPSGDARSGWR